MAIKTLEKNALAKYFEIFKEKFFKIVLLNIVFVTYLMLLFVISFAISGIMVLIFGEARFGIWELLLLSLPAILVGPAIGAVTKLCRDYVRGVPGFFYEDLKRAYVKNFRQCIMLGVLQYVAFWSFAFAFLFYFERVTSQGGFMYTAALGVTFFFAVAFIVAGYYFYMMAVTLKLKVREIVKNSFIFTMLCFLKNVLLSLILLVWIGAIGYYTYITILVTANAFMMGIAIIIVLTIFFGFMFYTTAFFAFPSVKRHILDPYYEKHPEQTAEGMGDVPVGIEAAADEGEKEIPEFVYMDGKMVHRSSLAQEQVFRDEVPESDEV